MKKYSDLITVGFVNWRFLWFPIRMCTVIE